jgi:hypothetical protein
MDDIRTHPIIDLRAVPEHFYAAAIRWFADDDLKGDQILTLASIIRKYTWARYSNEPPGELAYQILSQAAQYGVARECKE